MKQEPFVKLALAMTITLIAVADVRSDAAQLTAKSVAQDTVVEYKINLDQVIRAAVAANGQFKIDPNDVATVRGLEYEILANARLGVLKRAELPALLFAEGKPQAVEEIPGRILEMRLLKLNVSPWEDGLTNKAFRYLMNEEEYVFTKPTATNTYPPQLDDFQASYAYAMALIAQREWVDAARHLSNAATVPDGTTDGVWEFQIQVTRSWALFMAGEVSKAKTILDAALATPHQCEVPVRARYLARILGSNDQHLPPEIQAALPSENN